jgi:hypothetical protein
MFSIFHPVLRFGNATASVLAGWCVFQRREIAGA